MIYFLSADLPETAIAAICKAAKAGINDMIKQKNKTAISMMLFVIHLSLSFASIDNTVYAASNTVETTQKTDILEESRAQREKLRQSINNARAVLDSSASSTGTSADSLSVIRHTNGAAPSNYKPHGQLDPRTYDSSKIKGETYASETSENITSQSVVQSPETPLNVLDTIAVQGNTDVPQTESGSGNTSDVVTPASQPASSSSTPAPSVASSAPIVESSNPSMSEKVKAVYNLIPESIRKDYENNGWVIKIAPQETIRKEDPWLGSLPTIFGIIAGLTVTSQNTIYLDDKYGEEATAHEMGHYVDIVLLGTEDWPPSYSDEFRSIYEKEKNGFNDDYPKSDPHEYFAETFALYIEYAGSLQQDFPQTYDYMDRLISPYGGTTTKGKVMTKDEKNERYGIDFAEAFNFDDAYSGYLSELKQMIEEGLSNPATKRAVDRLKESGKKLMDDIIRDWKQAMKDI